MKLKAPSAFVLAAALGLCLIVTGCGRSTDSTKGGHSRLPPATVRVQVVEAKKRMATEEVVGTVRARLRASLEAKVSARIEELRVVQGQSVEMGTLLVELDSREIRTRLEQALAQQEQAERDLKRVTTLVEQNTVARQEFDAATSHARVTRAAVTEAETMLGYSRITAPFAGVITRKYADVGDLAAPGKSLIEMEDPTSLRFEADVPEALIGRMKMGAVMPVNIPTLERELTGTVREIAPSADQNSRTFLVKFDLPQSSDLRSGLFGRVSVPVKETSALRVSAPAVVVRGQLEMIFVVDDGTARLRLVKTGKRVGGEVELLAGVTSGERVVSEGAAGLEDGQAVEVKP